MGIDIVAIERFALITVAEREGEADRTGHWLNTDDLVGDQLRECTADHRDDDLRHASVAGCVGVSGELRSRALRLAESSEDATGLSEVLLGEVL